LLQGYFNFFFCNFKVTQGLFNNFKKLNIIKKKYRHVTIPVLFGRQVHGCLITQTHHPRQYWELCIVIFSLVWRMLTTKVKVGSGKLFSFHLFFLSPSIEIRVIPFKNLLCHLVSIFMDFDPYSSNSYLFWF
jgi:hypothetical protein